MTGAIGLIVQLGAEALAAAQADAASDALAGSLAALDKTQQGAAKSARILAIENYNLARSQLEVARTAQAKTRTSIAGALAEARSELSSAGDNGLRGGDLAIQRAAAAQSRVGKLTADLANYDRAVVNFEANVRRSAIPVLKDLVQAGIDPARAAANKFEDAVHRLDVQLGRGQISRTRYNQDYERLSRDHDAATASAGRATGAIGRSTAAHAAGAVATSKHAVSTSALAAAQRELVSDLNGVIARYDPARKAAADYAEELARIARLEAAGAAKGGVSKEDADEFRAKAFRNFVKARAEAFELPDVEAAQSATVAIDGVVAALRGEIAALNTLDPIQREMLKYRKALDELAQSDPEEAARREAEIRAMLGEKAATEGVADAARDAADAKRQLMDAAAGALDAIIVGGEKASDVVGRLARSLASAALEAAVFGTGPLSGLLKGGIGGLLGGGPSPAGSGYTGKGGPDPREFDVVVKGFERSTSGVLDRVFGTNGKFSNTLKNAGLGSAGAALTGGNAAAGALGGAIGGQVAGKFLSSLLGSAAGPLGSILGGVLGGAIGGLFTKTKKASATIGNVDGSAGVTGVGGNSASYRKAAGGLGDSVSAAIDALVGQLDGELGQFGVSIGQRKKKFVVDPTGQGRTKGSGTLSFETEQEAQAAALRDAIVDGAIGGISAAMQTALRNNSDVEKGLKEALKVREIETLLGGIAGEMERAFRDFEGTAKERVRIARQYGFDVVAIEQRNAEDRAKIAADLARSQVGSLQSLLDELTRGNLFEGSAIDKLAAINAAIGKARADLDAGVEGAGDTLAKLLEQRVATAKDAYGTTGGYASERTATIDEARAAIAQTNSRIAAAQAKSDPALERTNAALDENNDQNAEMLAELRRATGLLSAIGGGAGASGIAAQLFDLPKMAGI
ncbi:MAG: hypothetical protein V4659_09520 [Pseudomonadota bacterium]